MNLNAGIRTIGASFVFLLAAFGGAQASTFNVTVDSTSLSGTPAVLLFDFLDGGPPDNSVTLSSLTSNGAQASFSTTGNVTGSGPWTLSDAGGSFFNELQVPFNPMGTSLAFSFAITDNPPASGSVADTFSFFILSPDLTTPLITTTDPSGSVFVYTIGQGVDSLSVFAPDQPGFSIRVAPASSQPSQPVPEPSSLALVAAAIGGLVARKRFRWLVCSILTSLALLYASSEAQAQILDTDLHVTFSGLVLNRATNTFNTTATITNASSQTFSGALSLEVPQITPATVQLANATCQIGATPVLVFSLPPAGLAPGEKLSGILLKFSDPSLVRFTFGHTLFAGDVCSDTVTFHALSDSHTPPDPTLLAQILPVIQLLDCLPATQPDPMTLSDAMTSIQSRLDQLAGAGAVNEFLADNAQTATSTLAALAGGAMATNNGPGAMAALLAAHQNDPTNPAHLVNAGGTAALLGMPNEALALLDAADAMGGDFGRPMGFDGHAIAQNNRGFALLQLGQYSQAQAPLASANSLEPFLAEARLNAAVAELCQGQDATAGFLAALHRSPGQLTLDQSFDLSQGIAPKLPSLPYPGTVERLRAYGATWGQIQADVLAKAGAAFDQRDQAHQQLVQEEQANPWPLLTILRVGEIYNFGDMLGTPTFDAQSPPGLSDLYAAVSASNNQTFSLYVQINADFDVWFDKLQAAAQKCIAQQIPLAQCEPYLEVLDQGRTQVRQYFSPFLAQVGAYDRAMRAFVDPWYRALTGLAANLSDPNANQERNAQAQGDMLLLYYGLPNRGGVIMGSLATWWEFAQAPEDPSGPADPGAPTLGSTDPCSGLLKAAKFQGTLFGVVDVDISCEKVSLEIAEPGLGPFAQITVPRSGDWTAFMGVKGKLPGTTARFGIYIRGDDNSFTDAGIKSTQSLGAGPLKVESPFDMELGVAAAMKCPLGFCQ